MPPAPGICYTFNFIECEWNKVPDIISCGECCICVDGLCITDPIKLDELEQLEKERDDYIKSIHDLEDHKLELLKSIAAMYTAVNEAFDKIEAGFDAKTIAELVLGVLEGLVGITLATIHYFIDLIGLGALREAVLAQLTQSLQPIYDEIAQVDSAIQLYRGLLNQKLYDIEILKTCLEACK
jgi:hypothetical protein